MMRFGRLAVLVLLSLIAGSVLAAETSFLHAGEEILCVGDSITHQGVYEAYMQRVIDTVYPTAKIRVVEMGVDGAKAYERVKPLEDYLAAHNPAVVLVMFGVNDSGWSKDNAQGKISTYLNSYRQFADVTAKYKSQLVIVRESNFGHALLPGSYEQGLNEMLVSMYDAQTKFAAEQKIPIIDSYQNFLRNLGAAWAKDPLYEFTPDIVHPNIAGHTAVAGAILKGLGVGLPLAAGETRGPLHLALEQEITVHALDGVGYLDPATQKTFPVDVRVTNTTARPAAGTVRMVLGQATGTQDVTLPAFGAKTVTFTVKTADLPQRWEAMPLYTTFEADGRFAADERIFYYSKTVNGTFTRNDFGGMPVPVDNIQVKQTADGFDTTFTWKDTTPVVSVPGFQNRFGQRIDTALDLYTRAGQASDAVEFFFDLRPDQSMGRWTANTDSNPEGVLRCGVYLIEENGQVVTRAQVVPTTYSDKLSLIDLGNGRYTLRLNVKPNGSTAGFSMRITDNTKLERDSGAVYYLTRTPTTGQEPMSYQRLGEHTGNLYFRIGY